MRFTRLLLALLAGITFWMPARAQQTEETLYTLVFREVPLEEALEQLVEATRMNLLYDPALLSEISIFCNSRDQTAEDILRCITREAGLDFYRLSSGTYVLVEQPQAAPRHGDLAGVVIDAETGQPLPYANVFLADASVGTAANSAGMFTFTKLLTGQHAVVATYVGYEPALDSVYIPADGQIRRRILLKPAPVVAEPIIVNGMQQRMPSVELVSGDLSAERFQQTGFQGTDDVLYNASSIMAVGIRPPFVDLHIQGGASSEHQMYLDGVPIFQPVSLGRLLGAFSPLAIRKLTVQKAGFGAEHGSKLAGTLNAEHHLDPQDDSHFTAQLDPLSANGRFNFGLNMPGDVAGKFMVAGRTSIWDLYASRSLDTMLEEWNAIDPQLTATALSVEPEALQFTPHGHGSDVSFSDFHAAGQIDINPYQKVFVSAYQGKNNVGTELLTAAASDVTEANFILLTRDKYRWTNATGLLRHEWLIGARALSVVEVSTSVHTMRHNYNLADTRTKEIPDNADVPTIERTLERALEAGTLPDDRNRVRDTRIGAEIEYSLSRAQHLAVGLEAVNVSNRFNLDSPFYVPISLENQIWYTTGYIQDRFSFGLGTHIELGSRFTYVPDRSTVYVEPRLSFRHDQPSSAVGAYAFHLAAGVYRQYVNEFDLSSVGPSAAVPSIRFWLPIDQSLAPPLAFHYTANVLVMPTDKWSIRLESYYKHQPRLLSFHYHNLLIPDAIDTSAPLSEDDFIEKSDGYAYGGGIFVEHQQKFGALSLSYSYSQAKRRYPGRFENRLETTPWNEPHRISLTQNLAFGKGLSASVRAYGIWGRTWGFREAYYDYLAAHRPAENEFAPFDLTTPSAHTLAPYYQVDLGFEYERAIKNTRVRLGINLLNVLDRKNVVDWSFRNPEAVGLPLERVERTLPGFMTAVSLRVIL